jgi:hypothetical protein
MKNFFISPTAMTGAPVVWLIACWVLSGLLNLIALPLPSTSITLLLFIVGISWLLSALNVCLVGRCKECVL